MRAKYTVWRIPLLRFRPDAAILLSFQGLVKATGSSGSQVGGSGRRSLGISRFSLGVAKRNGISVQWNALLPLGLKSSTMQILEMRVVVSAERGSAIAEDLIASQKHTVPSRGRDVMTHVRSGYPSRERVENLLQPHALSGWPRVSRRTSQRSAPPGW